MIGEGARSLLPKIFHKRRSDPARQPRIMLFGDSHANAIQLAASARKKEGGHTAVEIHRLLKTKNGKSLGDTALEGFLEKIAQLEADDFVVSAVGGNQHAVFSTIQHPIPFDFMLDAAEKPAPDEASQLIPSRALTSYFDAGLRGRDGTTLQALRQATRARIIHLVPPPPKESNEHILRHHETRFASENIVALGVSSPRLRLKFWKLQTALLKRMCAEYGIEVLLPPQEACTSDGFLAPAYYARDTTHANAAYGELILREIERTANIAEQSPETSV